VVELRLGWFAPHRAGGWRHWLVDAHFIYRDNAPTWSVGVTLAGFGLDVVFGWGEEINEWA